MDSHAAADALVSLETPQPYEAQIARLTDAARKKRRPLPVQEGLDLSDMRMRRKKLARLLARQVRSGRYALEPSLRTRAHLDGKWRTLYRMQPLDAVVLGALGRALTAVCEPHLPACVYSYRKGRSSQQALRDFGGYLRAHRKRVPKRERGLYVLRGDIRSYGESIPTEPYSPLWPALRTCLPSEPPGWFWPLLEQALRPRVQEPDGGETRLERGIPTGSPLQPALANLYLASLDRRLEAVSGGFYARFGDDIVFAHPDATTCARAEREMDAHVASLQLEMHPDKRRRLYFTQPGRPSPSWPRARATSSVELLGFRVGFDGALGLKRSKQRALLRQVRRRLGNLGEALHDASEAERVEVMAGALRTAFDPRSPVCVPQAATLRQEVSDRRQLEELDYEAALRTACAITGRRGVRAFRRVPPRRLREQGGLPSFVRERNRS